MLLYLKKFLIINISPGKLPMLRNNPKIKDKIKTSDISTKQGDKKKRKRYSLVPQPAKVIGNNEKNIIIGA